MFVLNPPYTLASAMKASLPYLVEALRQDDTAQFQIEEKAS
jgi:23S rRNA (adenine2030-N6)-methyltransferase